MGQNDIAAARLGAIGNHLKTTNQYDVAVVGLGCLGSAAAYYAAKKGAKVVAFEQFEFGNVRGASHDTSRIVRTSYELPEYVALAKSAYKDWEHLEEASKQKLLSITGGVIVLPKNHSPNATSWSKGLDANNVPYELLNAEQANKRWPQFHLKDDMEVIYTADTGIVHAAKSVATMQHLARFHGAELLEHTKVLHIAPQGSDLGVTIETSRGRFTASKIILACDGWINELLKPLGLHVPLDITQEQVTYYKPSNPANYGPDKFPVWVLVGEQWYYGFPCYGEPAIKCAHDNTKIFTTANDRDFVPSAERIQSLGEAMEDFIPDPHREYLRTVTCLYTMTPDRQFIITPLEQHKNVIVTLGAGHAFKFAPAIGRVAAELAIDGKTDEDISMWGFPTPESLANPRRSKIAG